MSSLSIPASVAAASLRLQLPTNPVNTPDTRRPPPNANPPATAGAPTGGVGGTTTAPVSPFSPGNVTQLQPAAPPANTNAPAAPSPNANPASQAAQQITTSNAANSKAIQAGSNRIGSVLNINV